MSDARTTEELREAAADGIRWVSLARVAIELLLLCSMVVVARLIPPADFGRYAVALIVVEIALAVPGEGVGSALVQRDVARRAHLEAGLFLTLMAAAVLSALTLLGAWAIAAPVFGERTAELVRLSTPMFLIAALWTVPMAVLRRRLDFRRLSIVDIAVGGTRAVTAVGLAVAGLNGEALVFAALAGGVVGTVLLLGSVPVVLPWPRRQAIRELSGYGLPASLAAISWVGFRNCDYAIVAARLGAGPAGLYFRAYTLAVEYQRKVSVVLYQVAFPVLSRAENRDELFALRKRMTRLLAVILFPGLAVLAIVAPVVIPALFGPAWAASVVPTQVLCLGGAATLVIDAAGTTLMAAGRARAMLGYGAAHFAAYGIAVFAVASLGLTAVAVAAAVVHTLFLFVAYVVLLRGVVERPLRQLRTDLAPAVVSCAGLGAAAVPVAWALASAHAPGAAQLLAVGAVSIVAYLLTLRTFFCDAWQELRAVVGAVAPVGRLSRWRGAPAVPEPGSAG
jgi:lipopolysaccharide exporter